MPGTASVTPSGAAPTGSGGPFVGPYVAAKKNLQITILGGIAPGFVAFSNMEPGRAPSPPCLISCVTAVDNDQRGTLTVTPGAGLRLRGLVRHLRQRRDHDLRRARRARAASSCPTAPSTSPRPSSRRAPSPAIDLQAASDSGPSNSDNVTNAATLVFDVTFDVPVTGFLANDLSNLGTATGCVIGAPAGAAARRIHGHGDRMLGRHGDPSDRRGSSVQRGRWDERSDGRPGGHDRPLRADRHHQPGVDAAGPDRFQPDPVRRRCPAKRCPPSTPGRRRDHGDRGRDEERDRYRGRRCSTWSW